jgi:hypothetical protein
MPAQGKRSTGFWVGIALIVLAVVVVVVWQLYTFPERTNETQQSAVVVSSSPPGLKDLHVRLWVSDSVVAPGGSAKMALRFENGTGQELTGLRIETTEPGFAAQPLVPKNTVLAKGATELPEIELKPSVDHGKYRITVRYWVTDANGLEHEGAISTTPVVVRDEAAEKRYLVYRRVVSLFRDLTLPLVLALLGLWFQISQAKRDERLKSRDAAESRRQEIWTTILPHFYALSENCYLPIVRSLRMIEHFRIEKPKVDPDNKEKEQMNHLLFEYLYLLVRMDGLRRKQGQVFFKCRKGEEVATLAWKVVMRGSERHIGRAYMDAALEKLTVDTTYKQFNFLLKESGALHEVEERFLAWNVNAHQEPDPKQNFYRYTCLMEIMQATIYFEANRPFDQDWYEEPTNFKLREVKDEEFPTDHVEDIAEMKEALIAYRKEIKAYMDSFQRPNA